MKLTIFFNDPYWVGVLELEHDQRLYAARHIFGAEPSTQEVYEFVLHDLDALLARMTAGIVVEDSSSPKRINPKRAQRELERQRVSCKVFDAMRAQIEQNKQARQQETREEREARPARSTGDDKSLADGPAWRIAL